MGDTDSKIGEKAEYKLGDAFKISFERLSDNIISRGYELLVNKENYLINKKIIIKCKNNHIWEPTLSNLYKDVECNKCKCGYKVSSYEKEILASYDNVPPLTIHVSIKKHPKISNLPIPLLSI